MTPFELLPVLAATAAALPVPSASSSSSPCAAARGVLERLARAWSLAPARGPALCVDGAALELVAGGDGVALWWTLAQDPARRPTLAALGGWLRAARARDGRVPVLFVAHGTALTIALLAPGRDTVLARSLEPTDQAAVAALQAAGAGGEGVLERLVLELEEVLERKPLGQAFVRDFRAAWLRVAAAWRGVPEDALELRRELALTLLCRLLFVAFLQARGWLDGRRHFLAEEAALARAPGLYRGLLGVLFFEVLNTPLAARSTAALALGRIPYLNGGLFSPGGAERAHPERDLPDEVVREVLDGLFGRYVFAATETAWTGHLQIDPAMLGHIFEALMAGEERARTGSFYTPRRIVRRIVAETLVAWSLGALHPEPNPGESHPSRHTRRALERLFGACDARALTAEQARTLDAALRRIRIVDPAAGSGAFVIGAFELLVEVRLALAERTGVEPDRDALRRHVATHNLYGVDLLPMAVRLCELRLWLALSVGLDATRADEVPPLPNLDLSLRQGDALLELDDLDTVVACREARAGAAAAAGERTAARLAGLRRSYLGATGAEKARLGASIEALERTLFADILDDAVAHLEARLGGLERLAASPTLFGERRGLRDSEAGLQAELEARRASLVAHRARLERDAERPCFAWGLHFADVMADGGFDLVLGNPPWVRPLHQAGELKARLRRRYRVCHDAAWRAGARLGGGLRAGQVDLAAVFVERALQLVRPGGVIGLLVPAKLFGALGAGSFRRLVAERAAVLSIVDWSRMPQQLFGATTYPALLVAARHAPGTDDISRRSPATLPVVRVEPDGRESRITVARASLGLVPGDAASPWLLVSPTERAALEQMQRGRPSLGERFALRRGIVTGRNPTFVASAAVAEPGTGLARVSVEGGAEARVEASCLRPVLRGCDVAAWSVAPARVMLLTHSEPDGAPLAALPPFLGSQLARHEAALRKRVELTDAMPWWSLFRVCPEIFGPKVVWRDIAGRLEAAYVPATIHHALCGERSCLPLNTVYYAPVQSAHEGYLLAALLNSRAAGRFADALAEQARGGYRRYFSWVVGLVPWPFDALDAVSVARIAQASRRLHEGEALAPLERERLLAVINRGVDAAFET